MTLCVKSGGAEMIVTSTGDYYGTLTAWCVWHNGKQKMEDTFPVVSLMKVQPKTPAKSGWAAIGKAKFKPGGTV